MEKKRTDLNGFEIFKLGSTIVVTYNEIALPGIIGYQISDNCNGYVDVTLKIRLDDADPISHSIATKTKEQTISN